MPSANAIWNQGRHTVTFGGSYSYTQLNARDHRTNTGMIGFNSLHDSSRAPNHLLGGWLRRHEVPAGRCQPLLPLQRNWHTSKDNYSSVQSSLSVGLRFDYHGGLNEKNGRIFNFDPSRYDYDVATDTIESNGFVVAGNNPTVSYQGREQFDSDRSPVGTCAACRPGLEPEEGSTTKS